MKARAASAPRPGAATPALVYWLLVICGLAAYTSRHILDLEQTVPLWAGTVLGTALGQWLARAGFRLWLAVFVVANLLWVGLVLSAPIWWMESSSALKLAVMAFAPGALCGYLSLSERGGLVAFWFPAALWMLSILDRSSGVGLAGLALLFMLFLHARETRRVALWRSCGAVRIATPRPVAVLRRSPLRATAQTGWLALTGVAMLALTTWIAPYLWRTETVESRVVEGAPRTAADPAGHLAHHAGTASGTSAPITCCPEAPASKVETQRIREYFPLLEASEVSHAVPIGPCVACAHGAPVTTSATSYSTPQGAGSEVAEGSSPPPVAEPPGAAPAPEAPASSVADSPRPDVPSTAAQTPEPQGPEQPTFTPPGLPHAESGAPEAEAPSAVALGTHPRVSPAGLLLALVAGSVILHFATRPLRRLVTLCHLRAGLWPESVDQRVSNLWQLVLVGLRDAGWQVAPGEQPQELAQRVGVRGMDSCATVLERARHGVRVDADDLAQMERDASSVYESARRQVGSVARAAGWLRWPLV